MTDIPGFEEDPNSLGSSSFFYSCARCIAALVVSSMEKLIVGMAFHLFRNLI